MPGIGARFAITFVTEYLALFDVTAEEQVSCLVCVDRTTAQPKLAITAFFAVLGTGPEPAIVGVIRAAGWESDLVNEAVNIREFVFGGHGRLVFRAMWFRSCSFRCRTHTG